MADSETEFTDAVADGDITTMVRNYVATEEHLKDMRKRAKTYKESILEWMLANLEDGERQINMSDGSLVVRDQEKKESTAKKNTSEKIKRFFADQGLDGDLADELVALIYDKREVVEVKPVLSRRKKRVRKGADAETEEEA